MGKATLSRNVHSYRCPDCGAAYQRSPDHLRAVNVSAMVSLVEGSDESFACPCGSAMRFSWNGMSVEDPRPEAAGEEHGR